MPDLNNKIAFVAGGSGGIGLAIARKFVEKGATVYLAGRNPEKARAAAQDCGARPIVLDVVDEQAWTAAMADVERQSGVLDILVNAMGQCEAGSIEDTSTADFRQHIAVNAEGVFFGCRAALPLLRKSGKGSIINIGSIIHAKPTSGMLSYAASKAAMVAMSKTIALHCADNGYGIRVNIVHPGGIKTDMLDRFVKEMDMPEEEAYALWRQTHPLGRFGSAEEVADAALYFASDTSAFTTGAELYVDGGASIRP